jgi:hypothetical protein
MGEADKLRDRAARLFALSLKAREGGTASSAELEQLAYETLVQAEEWSTSSGLLRSPLSTSRSNSRSPIPTRARNEIRRSGGSLPIKSKPHAKSRDK